jgi:anaerobic magnesium-protoporphyrin IX monomethyl ester cyclase
MKNSIVFVNPPLSTEERYGVKTRGGGQTPPLGLTNLAAITRKHGIKTAIIDAAALLLDEEQVAREILKQEFTYVGFTAVTISVAHAARVALIVKNAKNSVTTIIGGPHLTAVPHETMKMYPEFDIGVIGEGDYTIVYLLEALEKGKDLSLIDGLIIRVNGGFYVTSPRERIKNLDDLPMPAWDLLPNLAKYYCPPVHTLKRIPAGLMVASRGCPGRCTFCANVVFGKVMRAYSAEYTFEMIKDLYYTYGIREIQLRDDNFTAYRRRMIELCEILKREKLDLIWTCAGRVDMVDPTLLKSMKEAGCWQVWYGIESGDQSVLDKINKNITIGQIEKAVQMTKESGISPCGFFILGHPTETKKSLEATIKLALKLPLDEAHSGFMTPLPGAEIYHHAEEYGMFDNDWNKLNGWFPVFIPHGLTVEELVQYSKKFFWKFYFRPRIVFAYLKKIKSWNHLKFYFSGLVGLLEFLLRKKSNKVNFSNLSKISKNNLMK